MTTTTRPPAAALPATGTGSGPIAGVAAALLAAGGVLFAVSRRTKSATD
ncbi:MAG: LPXTG cell wall anchor domain-containing protein [Ilumatobacteraceae bacterium]